MIQPTHIASIRHGSETTTVALQVVYADASIEVFRDATGRTHVQYVAHGIESWPSYSIRKLMDGEPVPAASLRTWADDASNRAPDFGSLDGCALPA